MEHGLNTDYLGGCFIHRETIVELQHKEITEQIIGASFEVYRVLGYGFLEKVYQRAMQVELQLRGLNAELESKVKVRYKDAIVGDYSADLFVENCVVVELKVAKEYQSEDEPQLLNELKATGIKVGLLINFGRNKVEFKRMVF
jgi:GxxExxY protein